jgi:hypothetical protein
LVKPARAVFAACICVEHDDDVITAGKLNDTPGERFVGETRAKHSRCSTTRASGGQSVGEALAYEQYPGTCARRRCLNERDARKGREPVRGVVVLAARGPVERRATT